MSIGTAPPLKGTVVYTADHETSNAAAPEAASRGTEAAAGATDAAAGATEAAAGEHDVVNLVSEDEGPPNSDKPEASAKGRGAAAEPKPNHKPEPRTNHCCSSIIIAPDFCSSI